MTMPEDGEYEIGGEGDDGVRVWLDGQLVVDDWGIHAMRFRGKTLSFRKGQRVSLKIEYFQGAGERGLRLAWRTPSQRAGSAPAPAAVDNLVETRLPAGADWYDFWTLERFAGGQPVKRACPLDVFPLYVRAGAIGPMGPVMNYATEKPGAPYEIRVYPGTDATFTIYEDDNETYDYEKGAHATTELAWDDAKRTLTIGERKGTFPGLVMQREFRVVVVDGRQGAGLAEVRAGGRVANYTGKRLTLEF
jgi:alpha-D-xyloside xylohydrolase